jgi:colanic acid/amylovoran biosynthesis protein
MHSKIIILGWGFLNKGAEALIISTISTLSQLIPNAEFVVVAYYEKKDVEKIKPYNATIIPNPNLKGRAINLLKAFLYRLFPLKSVRNVLLRNSDRLKTLSTADLVIDISGFGLTDQFSLMSVLLYCSEILLSKLFRVPFVVYPQAMGPFNRIPTKILVKTFLPLADTIIVRGEITKKYLEKLNIHKKKKLYVCADVAFLFNSAPSERALEIMCKYNIKRGQKGLVGIVPNMEIYKRTKGVGKENTYVKLLAQICDFILHELKANILFLPHRYKDDMHVIESIIELLDRIEHIYSIDEDYSASELKALIGQMDFLIASRFHSAIAALSMRVPVIIVGWSHKYVELMTMIGQEDHVIDYRSVPYEELKEKIVEKWENRMKIKQILEGRVPELEKSAREAAWLAKRTLELRRKEA